MHQSAEFIYLFSHNVKLLKKRGSYFAGDGGFYNEDGLLISISKLNDPQTPLSEYLNVT